MTAMTIRLGHLYPDVMCTYGDRGNVETILRRCDWRGIEVVVTELRLGDAVRPAELDLLMIGGGGESQQRLIAPDLYRVKGPGIRDAIDAGAAALAVGGGYELFGRFCQPEEGVEFRGIEVFDAWTVRQNGVLGGHYDTIKAARADRAIGELVVQWAGSLLAGFENRSGATYLGAQTQSLGTVVTGYGNSGNGTEGVLRASAVGTNLRGPCLPRNPALADFLISAALTRRYGVTELAPLADELELAAHEAALERAFQAQRVTRASFARTVLRRTVRAPRNGSLRNHSSGPTAPVPRALQSRSRTGADK